MIPIPTKTPELPLAQERPALGKRHPALGCRARRQLKCANLFRLREPGIGSPERIERGLLQALHERADIADAERHSHAAPRASAAPPSPFVAPF